MRRKTTAIDIGRVVFSCMGTSIKLTGSASAGATGSFTIGQSFNQDGQLQSDTYPDGSTQSYSYQSGRLTKVSLPNQSEIEPP